MTQGLAERFSHRDVRFCRKERLDMIELSNRHGTAVVTTHGGTVLSYIPVGGDEVLWVSEAAIYDGSKPVRGGIPVCWPWFGSYDATFLGEDPTDANKKGHGIARHEVWDVESVRTAGEATELTLRLEPSESTRRAWPHDFSLRLVVTLGETLQLDLVGENRSDRAWQVSEALHTYFQVAQVDDVVIDGLEQTDYLDKLGDWARGRQSGPLRPTPPIDSVYVGHDGEVVLNDAGRRIRITKENAASVVVWNPGAEGARGFADMPDAACTRMLCVETGNALDDAYRLEPGASHTLRCRISADR